MERKSFNVATVYIFLLPIHLVFPQLPPGYFGTSSRYLFPFPWVSITDISQMHSSLVFTTPHVSLTSLGRQSDTNWRFLPWQNPQHTLNHAGELFRYNGCVVTHYTLTNRSLPRRPIYTGQNTPCLLHIERTYPYVVFYTAVAVLSIYLPWHTTFLIYLTISLNCDSPCESRWWPINTLSFLPCSDLPYLFLSIIFSHISHNSIRMASPLPTWPAVNQSSALLYAGNILLKLRSSSFGNASFY